MAEIAEDSMRVLVTIRKDLVAQLDEQAKRLGISRASLMRIYISRGLEADGADRKD